jgi:acyl-CoA dehydrogenase
MPTDFEPEPHVAHLVERTAAFVRQEVLGMVQQLLADTEIHLAASRELIWKSAWKLDRGERAAQVTVDRSAQACGALGVSGNSLLARYLAEVRPFRIYDGPVETHRWSIGRWVVRNVKRAKDGRS